VYLSSATKQNGFSSVGNIVLTNPTTITLSSTTSLLNRTITVPVSTPLTVNLPAGTPLKQLPTVKIAATASNLATTVSFLDGVNTNGGSISILYLPAALGLFSSPVSVHISEFDTPGVQEKFALQMTYDALAASTLSDLLNLYLAWFDPSDDTWKNAVDGNSDGGAGAHFVAGAYDPTADFNLGWYGVDTANSTVWAVIDHNSDFGVSATQPPAHAQTITHFTVPEPSTVGLLLCGLAFFARRSRKQ
jgi:hypothetical protein